MIAGVYAEIGETEPEVCPDAGEGIARIFCHRLSFNLLMDKGFHLYRLASSARRERLAFESSPLIRATHIEITQTAAGDILEVVVWRRGEDDSDVEIGKGTLSMKDGDFTCEAGMLRLKGASQLGFLLVSGGADWVEKTFTKSQDGALVMNREFNFCGYLYVTYFSESKNLWARWRPFQSHGSQVTP